jgi:TRAP-type C4-dicarboxylate transport system permease small subunit
MVSVDVLYRWSPPRIRRVLDWLVCLAALALIAVIVWWGWDYSLRGRVQSMAGLESISMFWGYVAMPVGGMFCVIGIIGNLIDRNATNWKPHNAGFHLQAGAAEPALACPEPVAFIPEGPRDWLCQTAGAAAPSGGRELHAVSDQK